MPAIEVEVGICKYLSNAAVKFSGTLKHRFRDFCVSEVDRSGVVARITSTEAPQLESAKSEGKDASEEAAAASPEAPKDPAAVRDAVLTAFEAVASGRREQPSAANLLGKGGRYERGGRCV
eukprot:CAMPEP_0177790958 /NCGR_PEP_ID=MMETSP0491_2-20121128/23654_1 /TAXON_ID=63592 /ORGANISM="Tetraselmis chuii, Strain PLY429" /LENGTH=120 /DNA_ID=CAMNT_0019313111 /DNA_START=272 /DNA_END=631 /DNA_ORIENTATION=-